MLVKTVDAGLMANHLPAHHAIINQLKLYNEYAQDQGVLQILNKQIQVMKNHVNTMNSLLNPNQMNVVLPPIPEHPVNNTTTQAHSEDLGLTDQDIAVDAHFTASSMAKENFNSSENMKDKRVKKIHSEMALQQSAISEMYEVLMTKMGWMNPPAATASEQTAASMHLNGMQTMEQNQHPPHNPVN